MQLWMPLSQSETIVVAYVVLFMFLGTLTAIRRISDRR